MSLHFRLLTEDDVKAVVTMDDLIDTMTSALERFSTGRVVQPVRTVIAVTGDHGLFAAMPAFIGGSRSREGADQALGAKLVTVFGGNAARGLDSHLATIVLLDPETGALLALLDGRYITEARTAAVSAVSSRLLARRNAASLAIIGSGVQARSHLEALARVHTLRQATVWSPNAARREQFVAESQGQIGLRSGSRSHPTLTAVDHPGEAVVGADVIVLVTSSPTPVVESGWVKPGA